MQNVRLGHFVCGVPMLYLVSESSLEKHYHLSNFSFLSSLCILLFLDMLLLSKCMIGKSVSNLMVKIFIGNG